MDKLNQANCALTREDEADEAAIFDGWIMLLIVVAALSFGLGWWQGCRNIKASEVIACRPPKNEYETINVRLVPGEGGLKLDCTPIQWMVNGSAR